MGQTSSQLIAEDHTISKRPWYEPQPSDAPSLASKSSPRAFDSITDFQLTPSPDNPEERRAKAERKAAKRERKARRRQRREERARRKAQDATAIEPSVLEPPIPPTSTFSAAMPPKARKGGAKARSDVTFAIDPSLDSVRPEGIDSAERSTANMTAPVANMGVAPLGNSMADALPAKKKRGRKSNAERQLAQETADRALQFGSEVEPEDVGPRLLTELASAAHQAAEDAGTQSKKRKRAAIAPDDADPTSEASGKKSNKKKKKFAKRTDGATSRSPSPDDDNKPLPESGTFQAAELKILDQFMEEWKQDKEMTHAELADMIQSKNRGHEEAEGSFWAQVFDLLPRRKDRRSVRLTCRRRYHNFERRGKWEPEDDEDLKAAYAKDPNKWTKIGEAINRMPEDCKDRWQNYLACGDRRRIGDWTEKEEMQLALAVEECKRAVRLAAREDAEKNNQQFRDDQNWMDLISFKTVSEKMDRARSGLQCRQHWKRMQDREMKRQRAGGDAKKKKTWRDAQAADNYKRMLPGDKYAILQLIEATDTSTEENIPWKMISKDNPDSKWTTKDRKVAFEKLKRLVPPQPTLPEELGALLAYFGAHHANELNLFYTGPVRSEDAPRKITIGPGIEVDKTPAARIRKGQTSKRKTKSADKVTAADDEQDAELQGGDAVLDPHLQNATAPGADALATATSAKTTTQKKKRGPRRSKPLAQADGWTALPGDLPHIDGDGDDIMGL